jgi:hypothetical protein
LKRSKGTRNATINLLLTLKKKIVDIHDDKRRRRKRQHSKAIV